ncbi:MAG: lysozyme [Flavobacteriales bacterium]|jgi:lysozyme|nr:lysozyme [Flavobacteriales bacterium]MDP4716197.1 lysozyme [Flavobacteriales bacterium]MDP4732332.1 lysozyme [Flavobacteriales bacterium]MDP4818537.1 lysozyme [Flavobacteriales bacterium]MDP4950889.1 lysozyme [Flavobacteriales bacterium]
MKISTAGIEFIKKFEGLRLQAYLCPAGVWTIGYGSTQISSRSVTPKDVISNEMAEILLKNDLMRFEKLVSERISVTLNQNQFDALVSHSFNTGGSDTLFELINESASNVLIRNWIETRYTTAKGILLQGLVKRRKEESALYFND